MDKRLSAISDWINSQFIVTKSLAPASADASFRRYFRFAANGSSYVVMDAPPEQENIEEFIRAAECLVGLGLNAPEILAVDRRHGFVLLTDLGDTTYLTALDKNSVDRLYADAMDALLVLQGGTLKAPDYFPRYSEKLLRTELALFPEWYAETHMGRQFSSTERHSLAETFTFLCDKALEQPQVWVHRDYHSRNLMVTARNNPGILDFQDAVTGPITYDLVSLLRDCYIEWPERQVYEWVRNYHRRARQSAAPLNADEMQFIRWFDLMGIQRHLKVLGIFARLYHRDRKANYLADLPLVWRYLMRVTARYPELTPLRKILSTLEPQ